MRLSARAAGDPEAEPPSWLQASGRGPSRSRKSQRCRIMNPVGHGLRPNSVANWVERPLRPLTVEESIYGSRTATYFQQQAS